MIAIIGGTGLPDIPEFALTSTKSVKTPYSNKEVEIQIGELHGVSVCFLPRHGRNHHVPPHKINYRANLYAIKEVAARKIIAVNAVGGIHETLGPGCIAIPDQIIDCSYGREHTFFDDEDTPVTHIDFSNPYDESLRILLLKAATQLSLRSGGAAVLDRGVYVCMQGPRLETAAEIMKLKSQGCDMVGMTAMPEAALARELEIPYASIAVSVNWAAGLTAQLITMDAIREVLVSAMEQVVGVLDRTISLDAQGS